MDYRFAVLCMVIAASSPGRTKVPTIDEFLKFFQSDFDQPDQPEADVHEQAAILTDQLMALGQRSPGMRRTAP